MFTIKDMENLSGIKAHTIRIWEQRYGFLKPQRTDTNIRNYSNEELKTILNISLLNKNGFKVSKLDKMDPAEISAKIIELNTAGSVTERTINELVKLMVDLNVYAFDTVLREHIAEKGMEATVTMIIFPFLERIGLLWQTGRINPAQEHFVSNMIRQKLIVGIDNCPAIERPEKTILLFLPEGEHHEIGLLYINYLLRSRGVETIYLGANVPLKDAVFVLNLKKPDIAFMHLTTVINGQNFPEYIMEVSNCFSGTPVVVSGHLPRKYDQSELPNIHFMHSVQEVISYLSN